MPYLNLSTTSIQTTVVLGLATLIGFGFTKLYQARMRVEQLRRCGLPIAPGHNFFFGHLLYLKASIDKIPYKAHYFYAFRDMYLSHFQGQGVFYLDLWPIAGLMLVVISPRVANEAYQNNPLTSMKKPDMLADYFKAIAGGPNLFDMPENEWRPWRTVFNKGFNDQHLITLVPGMMKQSNRFCETLRAKSKGKMFQLDPIALRFMLDMIGQTILYTS